MQGAEADVVFNVVYTPRTFRYLRWFVVSLVAHSDARFRLVANGCGEDEVDQMRELAQRLPDQIAGVVILSDPGKMGHGRALNELFERHDDGRFFAFVDSDMKANGPYLEQLLAPFPPAAAVTSGQPGWAGTNVLPENATGVGGNTILGRDGFVYGSSYLAVYDRAAVAQQRARRGIGFEQLRGREVPEETKRELRAKRRDFMLFDTAKLLNVCLQLDDCPVHYIDHPNLVHIGGMSMYLSSNAVRRSGPRPDAEHRSSHPQVIARFNHAAYSAIVLQSLIEGQEPPPVPESEAEDRVLLSLAREELIDLRERYDRF